MAMGLVAWTPWHDLYASPGGQYLAVLDQSTGDEDRTDESLYVQAMEGNYVFDLATGGPEKLAGYGPNDPGRDDGSDMLSSPSGQWRIERAPGGRVRVLVAQGKVMIPRTDGPRWNLSWWVDDRTVVGTYKTSDETGPDSVALMSCRVPSGECEIFEETVGTEMVFPLGIGRVNADGQVRLAGPIRQGKG